MYHPTLYAATGKIATRCALGRAMYSVQLSTVQYASQLIAFRKRRPVIGVECDLSNCLSGLSSIEFFSVRIFAFPAAGVTAARIGVAAHLTSGQQLIFKFFFFFFFFLF